MSLTLTIRDLLPFGWCLHLAMLVSACFLCLGCDDNASIVEGVDSSPGDSADTQPISDFETDTARDDAVGDVSDSPGQTFDVPDDWRPIYPECQYVPFEYIGEIEALGVQLESPAPTLLRSAGEFQEMFEQLPPGDIAFPEEWAIVYPHYSWKASYGSRSTIQALEYCSSHARSFCAQATVLSPDEGCLALDYQRPGYTVLKIRALAQEPGQYCYSDAMVALDCSVVGSALGDSCTRDTLCVPGAICAGLTRTDEGVCVPVENWSTTSNFDAFSIPDGDVIGVESVNTVTGVPGVDADVRVKVDFGHPSPSDLRISLRAPMGAEAVLLDHNASSEFLSSLRAIGIDVDFGGQEPTEGLWTLHVVDDVLGNTGELRSWSVEVVSREP